MQHNKQETKATRQYWVVIDDQQALAVWPEDRELPVGWQRTGNQGTRAECLAVIELGLVARCGRKQTLAHATPQ